MEKKIHLALESMVKMDEFEKLHNISNIFERCRIRHDERLVLLFMGDDGKMKDGCTIPVLMGLKSREVLRDLVFCLMVL